MNIVDYLKWRGDITFKQKPLNNIDNLIFSYLSYVVFDGVFTAQNNKLTLKEACEQFYKLHTMQEVLANKSLIALAPIVMLEMSKCDRFKDLILHDYVNTINQERTEQFSALQIDIDDKTTYVAFCGTDDTLVGWKEDFQLSYKIIPAQISATQYLNNVNYRNKKLYVGGHSKGGNLALFSAACCKSKVKKHIARVFNNDGPNLSDRFLKQEQIDSIKDITTRIIPEFSFFGKIFETDIYETIVVKSNLKLLMQHDATSWQVEGCNFELASEVPYELQAIQNAINSFLNDVNDTQKALFIDSFFNALDEAGITNISEFSQLGLSEFVNVIKKVSEIDDEAKAVGIRFLSIIKDVIEQQVSHYSNETSNMIKEKLENVSEMIDEKKEMLQLKADQKAKEIITFAQQEVDKLKSKIKEE